MKKAFWTMLNLTAALFQAVSHARMSKHTETTVRDPATKYFRW
jgi:hypothetical protein